MLFMVVFKCFISERYNFYQENGTGDSCLLYNDMLANSAVLPEA